MFDAPQNLMHNQLEYNYADSKLFLKRMSSIKWHSKQKHNAERGELGVPQTLPQIYFIDIPRVSENPPHVF